MGANNFIIGEDENGVVRNVKTTTENELSVSNSKADKSSYNLEDSLNCILVELKEVVRQLKKINK